VSVGPFEVVLSRQVVRAFLIQNFSTVSHLCGRRRELAVEELGCSRTSSLWRNRFLAVVVLLVCFCDDSFNLAEIISFSLCRHFHNDALLVERNV